MEKKNNSTEINNIPFIFAKKSVCIESDKCSNQNELKNKYRNNPWRSMYKAHMIEIINKLIVAIHNHVTHISLSIYASRFKCRIKKVNKNCNFMATGLFNILHHVCLTKYFRFVVAAQLIIPHYLVSLSWRIMFLINYFCLDKIIQNFSIHMVKYCFLFVCFFYDFTEVVHT